MLSVVEMANRREYPPKSIKFADAVLLSNFIGQHDTEVVVFGDGMYNRGLGIMLLLLKPKYDQMISFKNV